MNRGRGVRRWPPVRRGSALLAVVALALVPAVACRRSHVAGTPSTDTVIDAFLSSGLDVAGLANTEADPWGADVCSSGKVSSVDVVICEFSSDTQLGKTEADAVRDWNSMNVDTGLVMHNGRTLLIVVDRGKQDRYGRAISKMVAAFRQAQ